MNQGRLLWHSVHTRVYNPARTHRRTCSAAAAALVTHIQPQRLFHTTIASTHALVPCALCCTCCDLCPLLNCRPP